MKSKKRNFKDFKSNPLYYEILKQEKKKKKKIIKKECIECNYFYINEDKIETVDTLSFQGLCLFNPPNPGEISRPTTFSNFMCNKFKKRLKNHDNKIIDNESK